jgi:hypothetical protein
LALALLPGSGVRPGDHPEFFRFPAPEGRSRESTIRLDADGRFWHEGEPIDHPKLAAAMHSWIARHPDDCRYILTNGYDWTYFTVDDSPFFVRRIRIEPNAVVLVLSDGTEEPWDPRTSRIGENGAIYAQVKRDKANEANEANETDQRATPGGPFEGFEGFEAKFDRHSQASLAPILVEAEGGTPRVKIGQEALEIG